MKNTILVIMLFLSISSCSEFNAGKIKCTKEKDCPNDYICGYGYCQKDKCTDPLKNSEGVTCRDTEECNMFTGECDEPILCFVNGEEKQIEKNCGYNNNGSGNFICNDGFYELKGICSNKDDCENGTREDFEDISCGINNGGHKYNICNLGKWSEECEDPDICINGTQGTRPCGNNNEGTQATLCENGQWKDVETCEIESCTNGNTKTVSCDGGNGNQTQICENGQWKDEGDCIHGDCTNGSISMDYCGFEDTQTEQQQICIQGVWECASFIKVIGTQEYDTFNALAFDKNGNTYITGAVSGNYTNDPNFDHGDTCFNNGTQIPCKDVIIIKFGLFGDKMWEKQMTSEYDNYGAAIAVDKDDNVYVTGKENKLWTDLLSQDPDIFLIKYDSYGNEKWRRNITSDEYEYGKGIAIDSQSNIYIIGEITGNHGINTSNGYLDIILAKYNSDGDLQWSKLYGSEGNDYGKAITITTSGYILIAGDWCSMGDCSAIPANYDIALKKIQSDGTDLTPNYVSIKTNREDKVTSIATDSDGNIYLTGYTYGAFSGNTNAGQKDAFLIKYTNDLVPAWYKHIGTSADDEGNGLAIDENKNVYVVGYTKGSLTSDANHEGSDIFIAKFTPAGQFTVIKQWGSGNDDIAKGISIKNNNLHIVGETGGTLFEQTTSGDADAFLIKFKD